MWDERQDTAPLHSRSSFGTESIIIFCTPVYKKFLNCKTYLTYTKQLRQVVSNNNLQYTGSDYTKHQNKVCIAKISIPIISRI